MSFCLCLPETQKKKKRILEYKNFIQVSMYIYYVTAVNYERVLEAKYIPIAVY